MKSLLLAFLLFAVPALAQEPIGIKDVAGWDLARWGMTTEQLQKALGDRIQPAQLPIGHNGAYVTHEQRDAFIGGVDMIVSFHMDSASGGLTQVVLEPYGSAGGDFFRLRRNLRIRYGQKAEVAEGPGNGRLERSIWTFPTTTVELSRESESTLVVRYFPTASGRDSR